MLVELTVQTWDEVDLIIKDLDERAKQYAKDTE